MTYDLTNTDRALVVFEIDERVDGGTLNTYARVMGATVTTGKGLWEGVTSTCYVMEQQEFDRMRSISTLVDDQDAFLVVFPGCMAELRYAELRYTDGETPTQRGVIRECSEAEAKSALGYTQLGDRYYVFD